MTNRMLWMTASWLLLGSTLLANTGIPTAESKRYAVICNPAAAIKVGDDARSVIKQLYLKKRSEWPNGKRAKPFSRHHSSVAQQAFYRHVLGMTEAEVAAHWLSVKQTTGHTKPRKVQSDGTLVRLIGRYAGAFSIIEKSEIAKYPSDVVVLFEFP